MNLCNRLVFLIVFFAFIHNSLAQNTGNSPYSILGLGDLNSQGTIRNIGMGNTGISNPHPEFINLQNPALLPVNKFMNNDTTVKYTMLEAGFTGQLRFLSTNSATQQSRGFNINYLTVFLPISKKWTTSIGLRPYSAVQNRVIQTFRINDSVAALNENNSRGSLNIIHFANGLDLTKNFSIGLFAGYIFGNITTENLSQMASLSSVPNDNFVLVKTGTSQRNSYSGFEIKPGIAYRAAITPVSEGNKGTYLNIGFTYDTYTSMKVKRINEFIFKNDTDLPRLINDTAQSTNHTTIRPASSLGFGIGIDKPDHWGLSLDLTQSKWADFKSTEPLNPGVTFNNGYTLAIGGEFKPSKNPTLTTNELRAGFSYTKSPITVYGTQINDISFNLGGTFPLGRKDQRFKSKPLTKINYALVIGKRGTTDYNFVEEQYFKLYLGALIHDKWFQRWKID